MKINILSEKIDKLSDMIVNMKRKTINLPEEFIGSKNFQCSKLEDFQSLNSRILEEEGFKSKMV